MRIHTGILAMTLIITSCSKSSSPSGPTGPTGPTGPSTPTISSAAPDSGAYNTTVTITGTNFSTTASQDAVTFNGTAATVSAATTTQLTVTVPKGAGTGTIKLTIGTNTITGPTFTYEYIYTVSTLAASGFNDPPSVAVDGANNILVGDAFNYKVRKISAGTVSTVAGTTVGNTDGPVATAQFYSPAFLTVDASDNVFVCDAHYIRKVSGDNVSTLYDGHSYSSTLVSFTGVALKPADTLVLLDNVGANVFQLTPSGTFTVLAGTGSLGYYDSPAASAQFSSATGIAVDANGNILVADEANQRIRMISPAGIVTTIAGSGTAGDQDGTGTAAEFDYPHGIAVDKRSGTIYVLEPMTDRIRKITVE